MDERPAVCTLAFQLALLSEKEQHELIMNSIISQPDINIPVSLH